MAAGAVVKLLPFAALVMVIDGRSAIHPNGLGDVGAAVTVGAAKCRGVASAFRPSRGCRGKDIHGQQRYGSAISLGAVPEAMPKPSE